MDCCFYVSKTVKENIGKYLGFQEHAYENEVCVFLVLFLTAAKE